MFVLLVLWKYWQNNKSTSADSRKLGEVMSVIDLMAVCYPVDLMLHGSPHVARWNELIKSDL